MSNLKEIKEIFEHVSIEYFINYFSVFKKNRNNYSNKENGSK